ncbi:hypothetical protein [Nocardiopsis alba]|uniref:hypothetical protein n=1 Tax=Nocardiopsis alba TaxID=53437 RepID=UPI0003476593|nr:hypothetical protein [Nocardiopsis alba]
MRRFLLCSLPLALALTACGEAESDPSEEGTSAEAAAPDDVAEVEAAARTVAEGFVASLNAEDAEAACAFMDVSAQEAVASLSEGSDDCVEAFPEYAAGLPDAEDVEIEEITTESELDGGVEVVVVTLVHPDEEVGALEMRESEDGEWRATRLPGLSLGGA